jgi:hypothetical protein
VLSCRADLNHFRGLSCECRHISTVHAAPVQAGTNNSPGSILLGLFAVVAAIAAIRDHCENVYLTADDKATQLTGDDNVTRLIDGQQCRLPLWGRAELQFRLYLPQWASFVVSD